MTNDRIFAWGGCEQLTSKNKLGEQLRLHGLDIDERAYSIRVIGCECFSIEFDGPSEVEASMEGTAASPSTLWSDVQSIVSALTAADVVFWLEVTDSVQNRLHYFHNRCLE